MKLKQLLTAFFITSVSLAGAQNVSYQLLDSYSIADMEQIITDFGAGGLITPLYPVDFYRVIYKTEHNDTLTDVSGAIAVPRGANCKTPLVSYQHGTVANKQGVPSYGSDESKIVKVFASLGNVVCAPDYIGLGASTVNIHPYMHGYSQAHSTINLLRSARNLQADLNYDLSTQLFLFGYSQGGFATAATLRYIEEEYSSEFKVTAALPMSGPYDISKTQTDFVNNGQPYATPGYLPYIILGYQSVYHDLYNNISDIFEYPYDSIFPAVFYDHPYGMGYINGLADNIPINMFTAQAKNDFYNDPNFAFKKRLQDNDLIDWTPQSTIRMYYCTGDEQVYYRTAIVADSIWNLNGAPDAKAIYLTNEDHGGCVDNALVSGLVFINGLLNKDGVEIILTYDDATATVTVSVGGDDINDYDIKWNDNSTGTSLSGIQPGTSYSVTLTHKTKGCNNTKTFTRSSLLSIEDEFTKPSFKIFPNPASEYITIDIAETNYSASIVDVNGKIVHQFTNNNNGMPMIMVHELPAGVYFVKINGKQQYVESFIKK